MKKVVAFLLAVVAALSLCACKEKEEQEETYTKDSETYATSELTDSQIEEFTALALYQEIKERAPKISFKINPGKTQYSISLKEKQKDSYEDDWHYRICGSCSLYDDYGEPVKWRYYSDESTNRALFEVLLTKTGAAISTKFKEPNAPSYVDFK